MTNDTVTDRTAGGETIGEPAERRLTKREMMSLGADVDGIHKAVTPAGATSVSVSLGTGGLAFDNAMQVLEFARMMSIAGAAVPDHCRGNPGVCLALTMQAIEWRVSPFAVAQKSYVVKDRIGYESQLVHSIIEARAPITTRLQHRYEGTGDKRKCYVFATFVGETEPRVWPPEDDESDNYTLGKLRPPKGSKRDEDTGEELRKGSPLWDKKPDLQLFYNVSRDWARVYCPDVLLGIYTREELAQNPLFGRDGDGVLVDERQAFLDRIRSGGNGDEGYQEGHADRELRQIAPNAAGGRVLGEDPPPEGSSRGAEGAPARSRAKPARRQPAKSGPSQGRAAAAREPAKPDAKPTAAANPPRTTSLERQPTKAATRRAAQAAADRAEDKAAAAPPKEGVKTSAQYVAYAKAWIGASTIYRVAQEQWDDERDMRDRCQVPIADRQRLEKMIDDKFAG